MAGKSFSNYVRKKEASKEVPSGNDIRSKQKKVRQQGYRAAQDDKFYPYQLRYGNDSWEDAKNYNRKNWSGSRYWQQHMIDYANAVNSRKRKK